MAYFEKRNNPSASFFAALLGGIYNHLEIPPGHIRWVVFSYYVFDIWKYVFIKN